MIEESDFDYERFVSPKETEQETTDDFEISLRPLTLAEYIGQLCLDYGGGGHPNAGTCQLDNDKVDDILPDIIAMLNTHP